MDTDKALSEIAGRAAALVEAADAARRELTDDERAALSGTEVEFNRLRARSLVEMAERHERALSASAGRRSAPVEAGISFGRRVDPRSWCARKVSADSPFYGLLGDIALVDLSQYAAFVRADMRLQTSNDLYFLTDETAFRLIWRLTGQPLWSTASKRPGDVTATGSWCILLAERA